MELNRKAAHDVTAEELIQQFSAPDGRRRQRARAALVALGHEATAALLTALDDPNWRVRWEAAKTLSEIADPSAIDPLVAALRDDDPEIRWLAGEALIATGPRCLVPLLHALVAHSDRTQFRQAAHFVLRGLEGRMGSGTLQPVLGALTGIEPSIEAPIAALETLGRLDNPRTQGARSTGS